MRARVAAVLGRLDLRDRVTLATAVVLAGGLAVLSAGALLLLVGQLDHDVSSTLSERADAQLAAVVEVDGRPVVRPAGDGVLDEQNWVFDADGVVLRQPRASEAVAAAARDLAGVTRATERDIGEDVRLRAEPVEAPGGGAPIGTVVVGVSLGPYERTEHLALLAVVFLDVCIVAFGALLARRAVGKALRPVADMTGQAAEWSEHDLDRRFDLGPPRDELTALSATLDALLARIAASVRREQRFSAEMAHELRTPLAGVRGEAELALGAAGMPPEVQAALKQVLRGADRMQGVIDALLAAARGEDGGGGVGDAVSAARRAVEAAERVAADAGVTLTLAGGDARDALAVAAEQQLVSQALAPLLDNAIRHARSTVEVRLRRTDGSVLVEVLDDGDGIAADAVETIFAPGASSSGGAGLGLPLARRIARSAGGDVVATPAAASGGGQLTLRLPALG
ncbi:MAG TPA: HAMP domain-containing sensor histidine kinase [Conexibacter sp.]|nr:HAMP domain-containing sensor histidine kinase [Conexibacter sp.]